jgi:MFS superfamily sulfate permease-like transporter
MTGAFAFIAGIMRLGFLDSVLSKPLLRGFISGVGFVIFVDQLLVCPSPITRRPHS